MYKDFLIKDFSATVQLSLNTKIPFFQQENADSESIFRSNNNENGVLPTNPSSERHFSLIHS